MSLSSTSTPPTRSRSLSANFSAVMTGFTEVYRLIRADRTPRQRGVAGGAQRGIDGRRLGGRDFDGAVGFRRLARSLRGCCALGPQRPGWRKQKALSEPHVEIEQIDDRALPFDSFGNQVDAEAAEQVGEVRGVDVR